MRQNEYSAFACCIYIDDTFLHGLADIIPNVV